MAIAMTKPPHYRGDWHVKSARLRHRYYADPATVCGFCGMTWAEYAEVYGERAAAWQVDHVEPGNPNSALRPSHARCNASAGAAHGNRKRNPSSGWI